MRFLVLLLATACCCMPALASDFAKPGEEAGHAGPVGTTGHGETCPWGCNDYSGGFYPVCSCYAGYYCDTAATYNNWAVGYCTLSSGVDINVGAVSGGVIAAIAALVVFFWTCRFYRRRRYLLLQSHHHHCHEDTNTNTSTTLNNTTVVLSQPLYAPMPQPVQHQAGYPQPSPYGQQGQPGYPQQQQGYPQQQQQRPVPYGQPSPYGQPAPYAQPSPYVQPQGYASPVYGQAQVTMPPPAAYVQPAPEYNPKTMG